MTDQLYKALKIYRFSYLLLCDHVVLGRKNEFQMTVLVTSLDSQTPTCLQKDNLFQASPSTHFVVVVIVLGTAGSVSFPNFISRLDVGGRFSVTGLNPHNLDDVTNWGSL